MLLTDEEVDTICTSISMKPGHRKRFPALLQRARDQAQENEDERAERKLEAKAMREAKAHERRLENARRRKELEAAETGAETQVATKEKVATSSSIVTSSSVAIAQTELPQGKLFGGIGLTMSCCLVMVVNLIL